MFGRNVKKSKASKEVSNPVAEKSAKAVKKAEPARKKSTEAKKVAKPTKVKRIKKVLVRCSDCPWKPGLRDERTICETCEGSGKVKESK